MKRHFIFYTVCIIHNYQCFFKGVACSDVPVSQLSTKPDGFECAACPIGLEGNGADCRGRSSDKDL